MRRKILGVVAAAIVSVTGMTVAANASTPADGEIGRRVAAGDTWNKIANDIAPLASAADKATFARVLACTNATDTDCSNDSLTAVMNTPGRHIVYFPGDVPAPAATTTTGAPTSTSTSTTIAATTTTEGATTTTAAATTTTQQATTTTAASTTSTTPPSGGPACGLPAAAYCDDFNDGPRTGQPGAGQLGIEWGVSEQGDWNPSQGKHNIVAPTWNPCSGQPKPTWPYNLSPGNPFMLKPGTAYPPNDAFICANSNGDMQMVESYNDGGGVGGLMTYPKQPFNFAGRTGTVVFDVSADSGGTHASWPEFVITDEPVPGVRRAISVPNRPHARNEVGFSVDGNSTCGVGQTGVGVVFGSVNDVLFEKMGSRPNCITKGTRTAMNKFKVEVSATNIKVYGTDAGGSTYKLMAEETLALGTFNQGLIWLNHVNYNARKELEPCECGQQFDHFFAWDNVGFDGPKTYRDVGFDVPDSLDDWAGSIAGNGELAMVTGYPLGGGNPTQTFTFDVSSPQAPTATKLVFNASTLNATRVEARLNGGAWVAMDRDLEYNNAEARAITFGNNAVQGTNTVQMRFTNGGYGGIANISLILVAGAPVP